MPDLIHQSISHSAQHAPDAPALLFRDQVFSYKQVQHNMERVARALLSLGIGAAERVAVYLPKQPEAVFGLFGAAAAGACFVPINPQLKRRQVSHILNHCAVKVLITSAARLTSLREAFSACAALHTIILVEDQIPENLAPMPQRVIGYDAFCRLSNTNLPLHDRIDTDMTAILYTSGSSGNPKGVVLSHRNMVAGARSVAHYLGNSAADRVLVALPLSFDAGLSQLTTAFSVGAAAVLMDYLLPRDVLRAVVRYEITGLAAVPSLWNQLKELKWPVEATQSLRYITNTGGTMPVPTTQALQKILPSTDIVLMYGLTEAFRSTYLPPDQVNVRPQSIGIAIPNAEVFVINSEGGECAANEPGELVHCGILVSQGYWDDSIETAKRFKPCPAHAVTHNRSKEWAVWSGDQVIKDDDGYLYFICRTDEMIKTSGYRVSPTEIEDIVHSTGLITEAAAVGLPHSLLGQAILLVITPALGVEADDDLKKTVLSRCRQELPNYMMPTTITVRDTLPHNANGKIDRRKLAEQFQTMFQDN